MASYYINYNGVNLTNLVRVRAVETTVLPPRENHAITIWERTGSIYNSYRYGERDIVVTFLIRATASEYRNNPRCMENKLNTLRNVFKVAEPKPLYLGDTSKYIYAVPEGDFKMTEIRYDCYECEIQFVCHNPEYYSASVRANTNSNRSTTATYGMRNISNNNNTIEVYNGGNASAYPIINIGINATTSFVQVENTTNGNKFLLGTYPKAGQGTYPKSKVIYHDGMDAPERWVTAPSYIDSGRDYKGTIRSTSDGSGIMINSVSSGTSLWRGFGAQRQIDELTDFEFKAKLHLNSHGVSGDPTSPQYKEGAIDPNNIEYFYKVVAPSVSIRSSKVTDGEVVGTYDKGDYVFPISSSDGWLQVDKDFIQGWCEAIYFKKYIADSSMTEVAMNVVAKEELQLMSRPSEDSGESLLLATIPGGTVLRVQTTLEEGSDGNYYKLYIPYNGKVGYVKARDYDSDKLMVETYEGVTIEYPEEDIIVSDDNKTGICEVYGYSSKGTKLFKLCLSDENQYYSYVTPTVYIGNNKVLEGTSTVSNSNKSTGIDEYNVGYDYLSDGASDDWNNFYGELGIRRENNKWQAWIYKLENGSATKKLIFKEQEINDAPTDDLRYIVVYMGTQNASNMCGMSITDIQVDRIYNNDFFDKNNYTPAPFKQGDEIKIDCYNNKVYLNDKLYNNIDMNSQFISLVAGNNVLKAVSEDPAMLVTVLFNERYL